MRDHSSTERRSNQLARILDILQIFGISALTVQQINAECNRGKEIAVCERTTRRDLAAMVDAKMLTREQVDGVYRYQSTVRIMPRHGMASLDMF